jgi:hypothetical protein
MFLLDFPQVRRLKNSKGLKGPALIRGKIIEKSGKSKLHL